MSKIKQIIKALEMTPHPEGGFYKESYRAKGEIKEDVLSKDYKGSRNFSTGIYFMLTEDSFSAFHKINQDEMWHFYDGDPIELHMITSSGDYSCVIIGRDISNNEFLQYVVPGGVWFASRVKSKGEYSLVGCTVSPGFNFNDFVLPSRKEMTTLFPQHSSIIDELTHR